jgi:hypothetical protein
MTIRTAPLSHRVFATSVLLTLGLGYALALVYLFAREVRPQRKQGHGLVQGVAYTYHGGSAEPKLLVSLKGSMSGFVTPDEFRVISQWVGAGATEEDYNAAVGTIIENNCASCHNEDGYSPPLTSYAQVKPLAESDTGMDIGKLARSTHVHLLGIPLLFYILGHLFVRTRYREGLKAILVVLPFVGVIWDISHWWLTKLDPSQATGVIVGGTLMSLGFGAQWSMTLWDVWGPLRDSPHVTAPAGD